jgi:hypothetical protein
MFGKIKVFTPIVRRRRRGRKKGFFMEKDDIERNEILGNLGALLSDLPLPHLRLYDEIMETLAQLPYGRLRIIPVALSAVLLRQPIVQQNRRQILRQHHSRTRKPPECSREYGLDDMLAVRETKPDNAAPPG